MERRTRKVIIEFGGKKDDIFKRNIFIDIEDHEKLNELIEEYNNTDIYTTVYKYDEEGNIDAPFYLDIDCEDILNKKSFSKVKHNTMQSIEILKSYFNIDENAISVYFSGNKGFHVIVERDAMFLGPSQDLNEKYKKIARYINNNTSDKLIDLKVYDKRRLFRIPNSINSKSSLYKISVNKDIVLKHSFSIEDMIEMASSKKINIKKKYKINNDTEDKVRTVISIGSIRLRKKRKSSSSKNKEILPCVQYILDEGVCEGNRNNTANAIACSLLQQGFDEEELLEIINIWNDNNSPPMSDYELNSCVKSAVILNEEEKYYGCTFYKDNDYCVGDKCRLWKK